MKFKLSLIILIFTLLIFIAPLKVEGHANYISSNPSANAILTAMPSNVTIYLSEAILNGTNYIKVYLSNGYELDNGQNAIISPTNPQEMYTPLDTNIPVNFTYDVYTVIWSTNSAQDGHFTTGQLTFAVQYPNGTLPGGINTFKSFTPSPNYFNIDLFSKFIAITVMIVVLMDNFLIIFVEKHVFQGVFSGEEEKKIKYYSQFIRINYLGSIAYFISMILWFVTEAIALESQHFIHVGYAAIFLIFDPATIFSPFYFGLVIRTVISLIMIVIAWYYYNRLSHKSFTFYSNLHWTMILLLVISIIIESITTHAGTAPQWYLTVPIDIIHYLAVSVWAGGILFVALIYYIYRNDFEDDFQAGFSRAFGSMVNYSIYTILVTGTLLALFLVAVPLNSIILASIVWIIVTFIFIYVHNYYKNHFYLKNQRNFSKTVVLYTIEIIFVVVLSIPVALLFISGTLDNFFSTLYGQVIIVKILLFGIILLFGPYNRFILGKIAKGQLAFKSFVRNVNLEAGLALTILFLACVLSYLSPPLLVPPNTSTTSRDQNVDNVKITLIVNPNPQIPGVYNFTVFLRNQQNNTFYTLATNCSIIFQNTNSSAPTQTLHLDQIQTYEYSKQSTALSQPRVWKLDLDISRVGLVDIITTFYFDIFSS